MSRTREILPRTVDDDRDPPEILKAADVHRRSRILRGGLGWKRPACR
jgi:hypothetical protein